MSDKLVNEQGRWLLAEGEGGHWLPPGQACTTYAYFISSCTVFPLQKLVSRTKGRNIVLPLQIYYEIVEDRSRRRVSTTYAPKAQLPHQQT
jgi:hypothetical protein